MEQRALHSSDLQNKILKKKLKETAILPNLLHLENFKSTQFL
jgi:hypothetical protein